MPKADHARSPRAKAQPAERTAKQLVEARAKHAEAERQSAYNYSLFRSAVADKTELKKQCDESDKVATELRERLMSTQMALRGVEADRDRARAHAEAMRFHAFPAPPTFEWERPPSPDAQANSFQSWRAR